MYTAAVIIGILGVFFLIFLYGQWLFSYALSMFLIIETILIIGAVVRFISENKKFKAKKKEMEEQKKVELEFISYLYLRELPKAEQLKILEFSDNSGISLDDLDVLAWKVAVDKYEYIPDDELAASRYKHACEIESMVKEFMNSEGLSYVSFLELIKDVEDTEFKPYEKDEYKDELGEFMNGIKIKSDN